MMAGARFGGGGITMAAGQKDAHGGQFVSER
jgi:hypothetical protein